MVSVVRTATVVFVALWLGIACCVGFVVAPYLFALAAQKTPAVPHTGVAAELIGPLLHGVDALSLVAGPLVFASVWWLRRQGEPLWGGRRFLTEVAAVIASGCAAVNFWGISPRVLQVKAELAARYGAYHLADKTDPLYGQFGFYHQTSTIVFVVGLAAVLVGLVSLAHRPPLGAGGAVR